jgi:hypothetical protein
LSTGKLLIRDEGPQAGATGTQYLFSAWSDGGAFSHTVIAPVTPTALTAIFTTEYQLSTTITGTGSGTINSGDGITCRYQPLTGTCSLYYPSGTNVTLMATASGPSSLFDLWNGNCSGCGKNLNCLVTMDGVRSCEAVFLYVLPARINTTGYPSLADAYLAAAAYDIIKAHATAFSGGLLLYRSIRVTIDGGFDAGYTSQGGYTTIQGKVTIEKGSLVVDRVVIR